MLDFTLGLILAALLVRGWMRGLIREVLDLVGLVAGIWIAFRLSRPLGDYLTGRFAVSPEVARIGAGIVLLVLFGVALAVGARYLTQVMRLPGLNLMNRLGGSGVATLWGVALVLLIVGVARALPVPESWRVGLDRSTVVQAIAGPEALPRALLTSVAGDDVLGPMGAIRALFGASRAVPEGDEVLGFPPAPADEVRQVRDEADGLVEEMNRHRAGLGLRALSSSRAITGLAEARAEDSYTSGELRLSPACAGDLAQVDLRVAGCSDAVALAATASGALHGIMESEHGSAALAEPGFDRVGVSVVDGPTGRLVVIYLAG